MFDTTPPHRRHRLLVCQTHQPLFGASFRKYVSQSVGDLASEARTRPAPGPRQGFFSDVTQFDLTDFAGQKRDLRTMEPVAGEIGHCFVVGARHQLRASMSAGWRGSAGQVRRNFRQLSPHRTTGKKFAEVVGLDDNLDIFFLGRIPTLARAWQAGGSDAGQVARQECGALGIEASDAGQECDARKHKWHLCF